MNEYEDKLQAVDGMGVAQVLKLVLVFVHVLAVSPLGPRGCVHVDTAVAEAGVQDRGVLHRLVLDRVADVSEEVVKEVGGAQPVSPGGVVAERSRTEVLAAAFNPGRVFG